MASLVSSYSSNKIILKLIKLIEDENYYEAHQLYCTIYFRFINSKRFEELESLLIKGCFLFFDKNLYNSGAHLANLYIDCLSHNKTVMSIVEKQNEFALNIAKIFKLIPKDTPEKSNLVKNLSKLDAKIFPIAHIHNLIGKILWEDNNYKDARLHFLRSAKDDQPTAGEMLIDYQIKSNAKDEVDLLITQFILQLLCMTKKAFLPKLNSLKYVDKEIDFSKVEIRSFEHKYAITTFQTYTMNHPQIKTQKGPYPTPLLNFIAFLLLAIEDGIGETFNVLIECYSKELKKDEHFEKYLSKIGKVYFNVEPKAKMGGLLENIFQTILQDSDEETETTSEKNKQPASIQKSNRPEMPSILSERIRDVKKNAGNKLNIKSSTSSGLQPKDEELD